MKDWCKTEYSLINNITVILCLDCSKNRTDVVSPPKLNEEFYSCHICGKTITNPTVERKCST